MRIPVRDRLLTDVQQVPPPLRHLLVLHVVELVDVDAQGEADVRVEHLLLLVALGLHQAENGLRRKGSVN